MRSSRIERRFLFLTLLGVAACDRTPEVKPIATLPTPASTAPASSTLSAAASASAVDLAPLAAPAAPLAATFKVPGNERVIAIGDIHGDLTALRRALRLGGAIDSDDRWVGGKTLTVVQTGDQVDRGDQDRQVLDVIEKLEADATTAGGFFYVLNGNHELMNASFDFRYVTRKSFESFADFMSRAGPIAERLPDEQRGRAAAFAPGSPYALKLARHPVVLQVGDSLFAHGGVLPQHLDYGVDRINREAHAFLAGTLPALPKALTDEDAPVWTRVYGSPDVDDATCQALGRVLQQVGAKRLVVGHTVQKDGISSACQERLFRIDVGLSAFYGDNPPQVLEITATGARVLKPGSAPTPSPNAAKKGKSPSSALQSPP